MVEEEATGEAEVMAEEGVTGEVVDEEMVEAEVEAEEMPVEEEVRVEVKVGEMISAKDPHANVSQAPAGAQLVVLARTAVVVDEEAVVASPSALARVKRDVSRRLVNGGEP
mmetsp:Transcript_10216/g.18431  ORF Transcript_10216/g.18431 Transcript_10216/m.18431 type:complete len:111 (-) Transcript_10216:1919-2251(-)